MSKQVKRRRGSTTQTSNFIGAEAEVTIDTTEKTAVVHDGSTPGGFPLLKENMENYPGTIIPNINTSTFNGGKVSGFRNIIENGDFRIWQRGITRNIPASQSITVTDRWMARTTGASIYSYYTLTPSESSITKLNNGLKILTNTSNTAITSTNYPCFTTRIENVRTLANKTATLSFWVKSTRAVGTNKIYMFQVLDGSTWSHMTEAQPANEFGEYTVNNTNVWEYKTITGTLPSLIGSVGLNDAWNFLQLNICINPHTASLPNEFYFTGIQLEEGTVATPFEQRPLSTELEYCQRYYAKSYNLNVPIGTITYEGAYVSQIYSTGPTYAKLRQPIIQLPTPMRATPSLLFGNPQTGATGTAARSMTTGASKNIYSFAVGQKSFGVAGAPNVGWTNNEVLTFHWVAISEL